MEVIFGSHNHPRVKVVGIKKFAYVSQKLYIFCCLQRMVRKVTNNGVKRGCFGVHVKSRLSSIVYMVAKIYISIAASVSSRCFKIIS